MNRNSKTFSSRRQFLRGAFHGIPLYLSIPFLESLLPREAWGATAKPMNLFFMYIPDGTFPHNISGTKIVYDNAMKLWYPNVGPLPASLPIFAKNLNAHRNDLSIVSGLHSGAAHLSSAMMLTGNDDPGNESRVLNSQNDSIDQLIGAHLAGKNDASAIQKHVVNATMGTFSKGTAGGITWGRYMTFLNGRPTFMHTSPRRLFDNIFSGGGLPLSVGPATTAPTASSANQRYIDVLNVVWGDLKEKSKIVGAEDKMVLERWIAGYDDLRKQLSNVEPEPPPSSSCTKPGAPSESWDADQDEYLKDNYDKICTAFMDIFLASFQCGARRVCTLMMQCESADGGFWKGEGCVGDQDLHQEGDLPKLSRSALTGDKHVPMAHYKEDTDDPATSFLKYRKLSTVNNYFMRKYAYFIQGMKARGLMDTSLAVCAYSFRDGNHKSGDNDPPTFVAGNGGGFKTGMHHRLIELTPAETAGRKVDPAKIASIQNFWNVVLKKYGISRTNKYVTKEYVSRVEKLFG